jgi:hypothetical protein
MKMVLKKYTSQDPTTLKFKNSKNRKMGVHPGGYIILNIVTHV